MNVFREVADIKTADQLQLPTPQVKYETVVVRPTAQQEEMVQALSERAAAVHNKQVDPTVDNMLKMIRPARSTPVSATSCASGRLVRKIS